MIYTFWRQTASNQFFFSSSTNLFFSLEFAHFYEKWIILSRSEAKTELRLFTIESSKDKTTILQDEFKHFFITVNVNGNAYLKISGHQASQIQKEAKINLLFNFYISRKIRKFFHCNYEWLIMSHCQCIMDKQNILV